MINIYFPCRSLGYFEYEASMKRGYIAYLSLWPDGTFLLWTVTLVLLIPVSQNAVSDFNQFGKKKHKKHLIVGCDKAFCPTLPTLSGLMRSLLVVVWFCVWWFSLFSFFLVWFDLVWCSFVCVFCFYCIPSCQLTCKNNQFSCFKMCGVGANTICRIYSFRDCTNEVKQNDLFLVQRMN